MDQKVMEQLKWRRGTTKSRLLTIESSPLLPVLLFLCLSSPLWCASSSAQPVQAPTMPPVALPGIPSTAPILGPSLAPGPAPDLSTNPTDPKQMAILYSLETWPEMWRQRGTVPNISDLTIPNRDPCASKWVGIKCNNGTPYQFIVDITVIDSKGGFPNNFLAVMSKLLTLTGLRVYQKGDKAGSSLTGSIPATLGQLTLLTEINFRGNQMSGPIPPEVASLPSLTSINLADNHFSGTVDQFCNSTSLKTLLLFNNEFRQEVPPCLGFMNLTDLNLGFNFMTGPIPESFGNLVNMKTLNIDNTTLIGGLNETMVAKWSSLTSLSLRRSNLSGLIPAALGSLTSLTQIMLAQNKFSGGIPASLGNLTSLTTLALYENRLSGPIPPQLGGMRNMTLLLLSNNSLSGAIPESLGKMVMLQQLHLQGNNFSGVVNGGLFANMTDLRGLLLHGNNFNGTFPSSSLFTACTHLVNVSLNYNNFTGPVLEPATALPTNLSFLLMAYNRFSGAIPAALGESMNLLRFLDLSNNSLTGEVPAMVVVKASTAQINLSFNSLNVTKQPAQPGFGLFNCNPQEASCTEHHPGSTRGVAIDVGGPGHAEYEADIILPEFAVGMFQKVKPASPWAVSATGLDGGGAINRSAAILNPDGVDHFVLYNSARTGADSFTYYVHSLVAGSEYKVDLGFVELVDDIRVGERVFDIWIQGELVFQGMDIVAKAPGQYRALVETFDVKTLENSGLLTIELRGHGSWPLVFNKRFKQGQYLGPTLSALKVYQVRQQSKLVRIGIIAGSVAGGLLVAVAVMFLVLFYVKKHRRFQALKEEHAGLGLTFFRYSELEAATNKWSDKFLLGEGAFGKVYRGVFQDGSMVAIKQLVTRTDGPFCSKEAFLNEARIISTTRHRNLIALLGCCFEAENPMFICEYMPNGSLHDALFVHHLPLDWAQRMSIAKDVATGLHYLHEETPSRIIHRDVKPANILLDEKMTARVADFGLARLVADQETVDLVTNVMGTRGYLAPEYALNGQLSDKVDVYSFGVVLLELVSGRHGLQQSGDLPNPVGVSMVQWAWDMVEDNKVLALVDPALDHGFFNEDFIRIVEISLWCTQSHPHMRPSMNQVLRMLLKQAQVPKLVEQRTNYEARDVRNLPINPFDEKEWPSYISDTAATKEFKEGRSFNNNGPSEESFDQTIGQTSELLPR